jgi:hypothetical protein
MCKTGFIFVDQSPRSVPDGQPAIRQRVAEAAERGYQAAQEPRAMIPRGSVFVLVDCWSKTNIL